VVPYAVPLAGAREVTLKMTPVEHITAHLNCGATTSGPVTVPVIDIVITPVLALWEMAGVLLLKPLP